MRKPRAALTLPEPASKNGRGNGVDGRHDVINPLDVKIDYAEVGLIAGLEVHQQLLTDGKMFCHCPAGLYTRDHDGVVLRHMRPTLSELGEYDGSALMVFKT